MKFYNSIIIILIIFTKTGNVLSKESIFNVNNIELINKTNISNEKLANVAIKKGFKDLIKKILLTNDFIKLSKLELNEIKDLVSYYQVIGKESDNPDEEKVIFNIHFDKEKFHRLFYSKSISYSEVTNKDLYFLPVLRIKNQIYIYNNNYYLKKWNELNKDILVDFILPLENIEIIQKINLKKNNLLNLDLQDLFQEYSKKNLALVLIDETNQKNTKIYLKTIIEKKHINKNLSIERNNSEQKDYNNLVILKIVDEITNIIKAQNLIDVNTPSFLNTKLKNDKINNLVELNKRFKNIDLIANLFIQELNKDYIDIKIKYFGKLEKIISRLEEQNISLKLINDEWNLRIIK